MAGAFWRVLSLSLAGMLATAGIAEARYSQPCKVRYETEAGRSDWYAVDVTFISGTELNQATHSLDYDGLGGRYGVIFWNPGQATVIKLDGISVCGFNVTPACMFSIGNLQGADQQDRHWEICNRDLCF